MSTDSSPASVPAPDRLSLSDRLAIDRTVLANERTFLAYLRTVLGLAALGVTALKLFGDELFYRAIGSACLAVAPLLLLWGARRFLRVRRDLANRRPRA